MNQASPQFTDPVSDVVTSEVSLICAERLPRVVVHFEVQPGATLSWRVDAHCELNVKSERVWLTRAESPYDYWVQPGYPIQLRRGERVWISTDGHVAARLLLTTYPRKQRGWLFRWFERLSLLSLDIHAPNSR
ncbi:DUF2917 domain-containing protein [Paraburkholderia rhizosphaerae]|uniref:DUF2917 family protein n=1 Tax=Paraburkholderia rhizosphaerae TaxID=480658 RepID=A0A4R8M2T6_9BURK|nr:DUF2917 domain-containing protein [Paraburkholderia rhizosphaerae]TDY54023.1 Protein of unknown function (DUF2917) [Paraburkholderia rhizosphaerae]